jgi:ATP-dependent exoDNAse (exonuclease V) beta subunit
MGSAEANKERPLRRWYAVSAPAPTTAYAIALSRAAQEWPESSEAPPDALVTLHTIGPRLPFSAAGKALNEVVNVFYAFFAADPMDRSGAARTAVAERILKATGFSAVARPVDLVAAHDRLREFLAALYPDAVWHREVPVVGKVGLPVGNRQVTGSIDLLLEAPEGWDIVDNKTYPGTEWDARAREFAPQLTAYRRVLEAAGMKKVIRRLVHFPVGRRIAELLSTPAG